MPRCKDWTKALLAINSCACAPPLLVSYVAASVKARGTRTVGNRDPRQSQAPRRGSPLQDWIHPDSHRKNTGRTEPTDRSRPLYSLGARPGSSGSRRVSHRTRQDTEKSESRSMSDFCFRGLTCSLLTYVMVDSGEASERGVEAATKSIQAALEKVVIGFEARGPSP